eukprot:1378071-Rhodomonas_salina.1
MGLSRLAPGQPASLLSLMAKCTTIPAPITPMHTSSSIRARQYVAVWLYAPVGMVLRACDSTVPTDLESMGSGEDGEAQDNVDGLARPHTRSVSTGHRVASACRTTGPIGYARMKHGAKKKHRPTGSTIRSLSTGHRVGWYHQYWRSRSTRVG